MAKLAPSLIAALTLTMTVAPAAPAAATCPTCAPTDIVWNLLDTDEDRVIPVSSPSFDDVRPCMRSLDRCSVREDVMFKDVDISEQMENYESDAYFVLRNSLVSTTTFWFVCSFGPSGDMALDCWFDEERSWGLWGENIDPDADTLRIAPIQSPATEYTLDLYVS